MLKTGRSFYDQMIQKVGPSMAVVFGHQAEKSNYEKEPKCVKHNSCKQIMRNSSEKAESQ